MKVPAIPETEKVSRATSIRVRPLAVASSRPTAKKHIGQIPRPRTLKGVILSAVSPRLHTVQASQPSMAKDGSVLAPLALQHPSKERPYAQR